MSFDVTIFHLFLQHLGFKKAFELHKYPYQAIVNSLQCLDANVYKISDASPQESIISHNVETDSGPKKCRQVTEDLRKTPDIAHLGVKLNGSNADWSHTEKSRRIVGFFLRRLEQSEHAAAEGRGEQHLSR